MRKSEQNYAKNHKNKIEFEPEYKSAILSLVATPKRNVSEMGKKSFKAEDREVVSQAINL